MQPADRFLLGSFEVRPDQNLISGPGGDEHIEPKAMAVLLKLAAAEGQTVPREELVQAVWTGGFVTDDALTGCVSQLRRAFRDDARAPRYIATVPKVGYRLMKSCRRADEEMEGLASTLASSGPIVGTEPPEEHVVPSRPRYSRALVAALGAALLTLAASAWFVFHGTQLSGSVGARAPESGKGVAVLPFANLSDNEKNAFFARGMQEEILSDLARIADLKVISRTSVMNYQGSSGRNMRDIGQTLGVSYVIEGSVQRVGDRIRVTAQLIDARRDAHLWADHYDRRTTDVFAIQSEIAQNIADQLRVRLSRRQQAALRKAPTRDLEAYALYDEARNILVWNDPQGVERSQHRRVALLERAIERDPDFALAYCALAKAHDELSKLPNGRGHLQAAKDAAFTALRLQPDLNEARRELGRYYYYARDFDRAYNELLAISRIWPNDAEAFRLLGEIDRHQTRWEDAVAHLRKAIELDPRNGEYTQHLQLIYRLMHRYDEGLRFIENAFARDPQYPEWKWLDLAEYRLDEGDPGSARKALAHLPAGFGPTAEFWAMRYRTALYLRDYEEASRIIAQTPEKWAFMLFTGRPPQSWADGLIARLRGNRQKARKIFASAREAVPSSQSQDLQDSDYWDLLDAAVLDAALGLKDKAIEEATAAIHLAPRNTADYPFAVRGVAMTYALSSEHDQAIEQLESIARIPAGPSYGELRFNPIWDSLRGNPRFEELVAALAPRSKQNAE